MMNNRPPAVAGRFYPSDPKQLRLDIQNYLKQVTDQSNKIRAIIVPHAGYIYSGQAAAAGYGMVAKQYQKAILMGNSHHLSFRGISRFNGNYETPLGILNQFPTPLHTMYHPEAHREEHTLEVQLPFLQVTQPDIKILPLIFGTIDIDKTAQEIDQLIDSDTVLIASSDLSHFHSYQEAQKKDQLTAHHICHFNCDQITPHDACGSGAIKVLLTIAQKRGWKIKQVALINSGDTGGGQNQVVGYGTWIFEG